MKSKKPLVSKTKSATKKTPKTYDHKKIEKKWQKEWTVKKVYETASVSKAKKLKLKPFYVLDMFPYPSGAGLHVGHPRGYIASDVYARMKRMQGYNVLHPMGFDSFGLPAEQYAIKTGKNPGPFTDALVKLYKKQLEIIGFSYDWSREVATHRPEYYAWTQWIFLKLYNSYYSLGNSKNPLGKAESIESLIKMFEKKGNSDVRAVCDSDTPIFSAKEWKGMSALEQQTMLMKYRLAYVGFAEVNWCPELGTVLANDEIVDGPEGAPVSERGGFPVEKRKMRQWFMRITAYADRLLSGLDTIDWSSHIKEIERNWIGKSEGSEIGFNVVSVGNVVDENHLQQAKRSDKRSEASSIVVFTTRADTLFGVTYVVLAPEHQLLENLKSQISNWNEVARYLETVKNKTDEDRLDTKKEKTGIKLEGVKAINPANGEEVSVWVADYVLAGYGTGAVMAVPAHDERDFEFARKYKISIKRVIADESNIGNVPEEYRSNPTKYLEIVEAKDFCFTESGQLINSGQFNNLSSEEARKKITEFVGGKLVTKYKMRDAIFARQRYWGEPIPLSTDKNGIIHEVKKLPLTLPQVKSYTPSGNGESPLSNVKDWVKNGYETNTMPGWAGSSWYFLRYMDSKNKTAFAGKEAIDYWKQVDMYVGGSEHATGHLLYARFWHKFLKDIGVVPTEEPFKALRNQGLIMATDGRKMSKRWGNVINPDDVVATYGADTLRFYEMFMGPFDQSLPWSTESIIGSRRFIERVWRMGEKISHKTKVKTQPEAEKVLHKTIKKVTEDISNFNFNTAVSSMMICINELEKSETVSSEDFKKFLKIISPFAPHVTEEIWCLLGEKKSIHISAWPDYDKKKIIDDTIKIALQINSKVRAEVEVPASITEEELKHIVFTHETVKQWVGDKEVKRFIHIKGKLVNILC